LPDRILFVKSIIAFLKRLQGCIKLGIANGVKGSMRVLV